MYKKVVLALFMAALLVGGAFAEESWMSAGAGGFFDFSGNNGVKDGGNYLGARNFSLGAYLFFDLTYAEIDISYAYGKVSGVVDGYDEISRASIASRLWQLGFSFLGKYPFEVGDFTIFPLLGFDYNFILSHIMNGVADTEPRKWNQFGILAGAGADFDLTDNLYLRGEGLFHLRFPSEYWKEVASNMDGSATLGMGFRMKLGVGYRF
jgi:opacity protein-like surface antigen